MTRVYVYVYVCNPVTRKRERVTFTFREEMRQPPQGFGAPTTYRVTVRGGGHERFVGVRYKPAPACAAQVSANLRRWCADVVSFALAYVERPEEFDRHVTHSDARDPHVEQQPWNRAWWETFGDELTMRFDAAND